uniref:hypothetical protein n=1 Tax=Thermogutta sp. TaxID=1962930 RepID=UPI00321F75B4
RTRTDRFWMLPIVQEYARGKLAEAPDVEQVLRDRWVRWYQNLLEGYPADPRIYEETPNIVSVLFWLPSRQRWEELVQQIDKGIMVLYDTGSLSSVLEIGSSLLNQVLITGSVELLRFSWLSRYGDGMSLYGRFDEFQEKWESLIALLEEGKTEKHPELDAIRLGIQARIARWKAWTDRQHLGPAIRVIEQAVDELSHLDRPADEILLFTLNSLGVLYLLARDPDRAEQTFLRGLDALSKCETCVVSPTSWDAVLRGNIAIVAARRGDYEKARDGLYQILPNFHEKTDLAEAYMLLAVYEYHLGNLPRAIELGFQAERLFAELGIVKPPWEEFEYQEWLKIKNTYLRK